MTTVHITRIPTKQSIKSFTKETTHISPRVLMKSSLNNSCEFSILLQANKKPSNNWKMKQLSFVFVTYSSVATINYLDQVLLKV